MALSLLLDTTQGCTSFVGRTSQTGVLRTFTIGADTLLLDQKRVAEASEHFRALREPDSDDAKRLEARLALLADGTAESLEALAARVAAFPEDWDSRYRLAKRYAAEGQWQPALEALLAIVARARDWNDGAARKLILQIFDLMRPGDPLLREYRMRLANLLNR